MEEDFPYKLYRVIEGRLYLIGQSKNPERLLRSLEGLKMYTSRYIVAKVNLEILGSTK